MKKHLSFTVILVLVAMFGCKVGPNFETPVVQTEPYFRYDSLRNDTVVNLMWWELFKDEQLQALSAEQWEVVRAIIRCRTAALGGHLWQCDHCGHNQIAYNSCRNRHCRTSIETTQKALLQIVISYLDTPPSGGLSFILFT